MYCKQCGKFLAGNENFCSNCGTKIDYKEEVVEETVETKTEANTCKTEDFDWGISKSESKIQEETIETTEEKESIKMMSPVDDFKWDLKEFPSAQNKKTEDADIRWRSDDMFLHKEINKAPSEDIMDSFESFDEPKAEEPVVEISEEHGFIKENKPNITVEKKKTLEKIDIPPMFKDKSNAFYRDFSRDIPKDKTEETEEKISFEKGGITRNTAPLEEDYQTDDRVVEIEQPTNSGISVEVTQEADSGIKIERVIVDEPETMATKMMEENDTTPSKDNFLEQNEKSVEKSIKTDNTTVEKVEKKVESEPTLFDEIAPKAVETLEGARINDEKKQIDKFYTFNKKKEEFQKLLDKEYERIERKCEPGGFEDDISSFMDVERGTAVEGTTQLEEMVRARELFFDDPYYIPKEESEKLEEIFGAEEGIPEDELVAKEEKKVILDEQLAELDNPYDEEETIEIEPEGVSSTIVFEPERDELLSDSLVDDEEIEEDIEEIQEAATEILLDEIEEIKEENIEDEEVEDIKEESKEEKTEDPHRLAKVIIDPKDKPKKSSTEELAKEFFDNDEEDAKRGTGTKVAIWILSIIIVIIVALLVIRITMPDATISKEMDNIANRVVTFFDKSDDSEAITVDDTEGTDREAVSEDKTGLIQLQIGQNYQNIIESIRYSSDAKYSSDVAYTIADISNRKELPTNIWYTDSEGVKHYYDEEIVGTIIAFESSRAALINNQDTKVFEVIEPNSNLYNKIALEGENGGDITFNLLEIGDIKSSGDNYYVWVNELINGENSKKVYQLKESNNKLLLNDVSEA